MLALFITITVLKNLEPLDNAVYMLNSDPIFGYVTIEQFL